MTYNVFSGTLNPTQSIILPVYLLVSFVPEQQEYTGIPCSALRIEIGHHMIGVGCVEMLFVEDFLYTRKS